MHLQGQQIKGIKGLKFQKCFFIEQPHCFLLILSIKVAKILKGCLYSLWKVRKHLVSISNVKVAINLSKMVGIMKINDGYFSAPDRNLELPFFHQM